LGISKIRPSRSSSHWTYLENRVNDENQRRPQASPEGSNAILASDELDGLEDVQLALLGSLSNNTLGGHGLGCLSDLNDPDGVRDDCRSSS